MQDRVNDLDVALQGDDLEAEDRAVGGRRHDCSALEEEAEQRASEPGRVARRHPADDSDHLDQKRQAARRVEKRLVTDEDVDGFAAALTLKQEPEQHSTTADTFQYNIEGLRAQIPPTQSGHFLLLFRCIFKAR